ncbi:MAG: 6,7-dimethyl-8-ribityllumazine synthase [Rhodospirillaceae bacterium]|jgi:6,7-dimethyl-8-ribityllumazine synthase
MPDTPSILLIEARYYEDIADAMAEGARQVIDKAGEYEVERIAVPGVFEVPAAVKFAHQSKQSYTGIIALGCVIRGETDHYEHVCREASRALMDLSVNDNIALGFGILTCDTKQQAEERAATGGRNKGAEAAQACLRMIELKQSFHQ